MRSGKRHGASDTCTMHRSAASVERARRRICGAHQCSTSSVTCSWGFAASSQRRSYRLSIRLCCKDQASSNFKQFSCTPQRCRRRRTSQFVPSCRIVLLADRYVLRENGSPLSESLRVPEPSRIFLFDLFLQCSSTFLLHRSFRHYDKYN